MMLNSMTLHSSPRQSPGSLKIISTGQIHRRCWAVLYPTGESPTAPSAAALTMDDFPGIERGDQTMNTPNELETLPSPEDSRPGSSRRSFLKGAALTGAT